MQTFIFFFCILFALSLGDFKCGNNFLHTTTFIEIPEQNFDSKRGTPGTGSFSLDLNFQPTISQPANEPQRIQFQRAADVWEELLRDTPATVTLDVDVAALGDSILGQASSSTSSLSFSLLTIPLAKRTENTYPTQTQFSATFQSGDSFSGSISVNTAILRSLGILPGTGTDGTITFSTRFPFDTDLSDGLTNGQADFLAVAIHEFGHLLGFTSAVDVFDSSTGPQNINPIDLHRFNVEPVDFITSQRVLAPNIDPHIYFRGNRGGATPLLIGRLSRGRNSGDGQQASHWMDDNNDAAAIEYIGIMDPVLPLGLMAGITPADVEAFRGFGYIVNDPPCPIIYGSFDSLERGSNVPSVLTSGVQGDTVVIVGQLFSPDAMCRFGIELVPVIIPTSGRFSQIECTIGIQGGTNVSVTNDGVTFSNAIPFTSNNEIALDPICGNGALEMPEECDDGNLVDGDNCTSSCGIVSTSEDASNSSDSSATNSAIIAGVAIGFACCLILVVGIAIILALFLYKKRDQNFQNSNPLYGNSLNFQQTSAPTSTKASIISEVDVAPPRNGPLPIKSMDEIHGNMNKPPVPQTQKPPIPQTQKPPIPQTQELPNQNPYAIKQPNFQKDSIVKAKYSQDNQFYNAKVLEYDPASDQYYVNYYQFGSSSEWVLSANMKN